MDRLWAILLVIFLAFFLEEYRSGRLCAYMGTDFRGYYASAQIAWQRGFTQVYDPAIQEEYQALLFHRCPDSAFPQPMPRVSMPYLPVFVLFFLPLTFIDFTTSYLAWATLNLAILALYLRRFSRAMGAQTNNLRLLQWLICVPVISNLFLGQMNLWLVVCMGEFLLAFLAGRRGRSGLWLAGFLLKPHTLILLLPGLLLSRNWRVLQGFLVGLLIVLAGSFLLAGVQGMQSMAWMVYQFAGPLIQTASAMMNFRALALNLQHFLPAWFAWAIAVLGMCLVASTVIFLWLRRSLEPAWRFVLLLLATATATCALAWHSHFYLLMSLIPLLLFLDGVRLLPLSVFSAWLLGPPVLYLGLYLARPDLSRNLFGLGMLALDLFLFCWAVWALLGNSYSEANANQ